MASTKKCELIEKLETWSTLDENASRYHELQQELFTDRKLDFLNDSLEALKTLEPGSFDEHKVDDAEVTARVSEFLQDYGGLVTEFGGGPPCGRNTKFRS